MLLLLVNMQVKDALVVLMTVVEVIDMLPVTVMMTEEAAVETDIVTDTTIEEIDMMIGADMMTMKEETTDEMIEVITDGMIDTKPFHSLVFGIVNLVI